MPRRGDFSFIVNETISITLTHDYNKLNEYNLWGLLENDFLINSTRVVFYNRHTDITFNNNITYLKYIYLHGWVEFVIKCLNSL